MANFNIDYLIVAGGGGGGSASSGYSGGGAGGAGGYRTSYGTGNISGGNSPVESALNLTTGTSYTITVGDGGAGGPAASPINAAPPSGTKGDNSVFASITSEGGGYGVGQGQGAGGSGGSAGGGGGSGGAGGTGTSNQGSNGGTGTTSCPSNACLLGGGGGGASQAGSSVQAGKGGNGLSSSITGTSVIRAGGGSGGSYGPIGWNDPIAGGAGGGGAAGVQANGYVGQPGTANTGGGGGGATWYTNQVSRKGGDGGSGIVILRYVTTDANYTATGLTPTETTDGTDTILSFTTVGTGTITFSPPPPPPFSGTKVTTPVTDFNKINTEEGLKMPSGTSSNQPTGVGGMVRNDTTQSIAGSSSAITYYNGTNWRYFENELNTSFNTVLYTGDGANPRSITGVGFEPDLLWIKKRSSSTNASNMIFDSVRGADKVIISNSTQAQYDGGGTGGGYQNSFNADGFTVTGNAFVNQSSQTYVAWCFKAGGLINKAADFNGSSSTVSLPGTPLNSLTSITYSAWVYYRGTGSGQSYGHIISGGSTSNQSAGKGLGIAVRNSDDLLYIWKTNGSVFSTTTLPENEWSHVALTNNAGAAKLYLNGAEVFTTTLDALNFDSSGNIIDIGEYFYNGSHHFYGSISQVRIFNNALSSSEITQLYNETKADNSVLNFPSGAGCVAAYPLGENANGVDGLYNGTSSNVTFNRPGYLTINTEGTIESTVSVNNDLGFSIVSYTGNLSGATTATGQSVGHGMDVSPELIIFKSTSNSTDWNVFSSELDNWSTRLELNDTVTKNDLYSQYPIADPTSNVFYTNYLSAVNVNNYNYIAYCFASKPNYSKTGTYLGNGNATGPIVTLGFEPAFVMIKGVDQSGDWTILDNKRDTSNPNSARLDANSTMAEYSAVGLMDFNSDGFQIVTTQASQNASGKTFIYLAFANTI